ncbi:MAG: DUF4079 domain-containing protein [Microcystis aeruginosa K13-05]|jgi:hypothetical protein|uniref:DUF4079 domain-containing protein n=4 Tax=Microcystis TaxID=1125 RepID=A0A510PE77_MICAE|nr:MULTISPECIES: DUF4079 domain-containing protein [Microcystis]MCE2663327.1 DUF4079 domain-containing protein [Microcystis sp. 53602_E8]MCE2672237.1 DUF4079 domain-containing protein [Microcystis sp. 53598_E5]MDJ0544782.1 DUF4079 domain-containing protein [Microcystis sp. M53601_WE4]MDJ0561021.1 DUF4079 domain-containing protein [Microcystis sp. M53599_WE4]MDJ0563465.1 DUF4079 domain-containing protein [Microcystis sp. M49629_WE12]NCR81899.1 DUF4079 domain-containing protein [Microcystis aer
MNLPSFLWLWKIAAWSMGFTLFAYFLLAVSGVNMGYRRLAGQSRPKWLRSFHLLSGLIMVALVLILLGIGLVGTIGHYGSLGHSSHLIAGLSVVFLVFVSAISGLNITTRPPLARSLHIGTNLLLFLGFLFVTLTGWDVVQKYLQ